MTFGVKHTMVLRMAVEMSASVGALIVCVAEARGAEPGALSRLTGFDPACANDPDARISLALEERLWSEAARLANDDAIGLHAAEFVRPGAFEVMDYAIRTASTLRGALLRLIRYHGLVHDVSMFGLHETVRRARVEHAFRGAGVEQSRHSAEFTLAATTLAANAILGAPLRLRAVEFRTAAPRSAEAFAEHRRVFGLTPVFSARVNALEFDGSELDRSLASPDPVLSSLVERHCDALLASMPDPADSTAQHVRHSLTDMLGKESATLTSIAERLRTSERCLRERLATEGSSFDALLDDVRRALALRYLAEPKLAIREIAYLLGYSEPSPFQRAFKRWTGMTPSAARRVAA